MLQFLAVTNDRYELPIASADTTTELAQMLGIPRNSINVEISHPEKYQNKKKQKYYRIIVVEIDDYDDPLGNVVYINRGEQKIKERLRRLENDRIE